MVLEIASVSNPKVKAAVKLRDNAKERRRTGTFFLEGLRLCRDAARCGFLAETVFFTLDFKEKFYTDFLEITANAKTTFSVSEEVMRKLSDTVNPQGVVSVCAIPTFDNLDNSGLYLALEKTADPSNLGAIARSAEAFGVKGIYISSESCDPYSPKSLRAGMGALLRLPIIVCSNFLETLKELKMGGATLYASVVTGEANDVKTVIPSDYSVLLIGNEANGLSREIVDISEKVTIKMQGRAESLNAAAAAAVLIWEFLRG